jgi:hypothetical protein
MSARGGVHDGVVVVAHDDLEYAKRVEESCVARGMRVHVVRHGAAALEATIADVPDVLVTAPSLALIDVPKLAEILRSNPRTQAVRFVLIGIDPQERGPLAFADDALPQPAEPDDVAARIEALVAQRARLDAAHATTREGHALEGQIAQISLADLLQLFHLNRRTGVLDLARRDAAGREERGRLFVRDGNVVQASLGAVEAEKALYRLLTWRTGTFAFSDTRVTVPARIQSPTRALLMEGMRQLDEWDRLISTLPPLDAHVSLKVKSSELPHIVHPLTQEVLLLVEIYPRVQDVMDHCSHPDYQVLRTLQTLVERGIVATRRESTGASASSSEALFSPGQVRRLREWLDGWGGRGSGTGDAKLLLVSATDAPVHAFLRGLRALPGASVRALDRLPACGVVARLQVDAETGIELVHVPADPAAAPLWKAAGHRALGALLLLTSPVAAAMGALHAATEALRGLPRARLFHLLLADTSERALPDELRENVALLDETSLFLLPLESAKDPASLLRGLCARIVP